MSSMELRWLSSKEAEKPVAYFTKTSTYSCSHPFGQFVVGVCYYHGYGRVLQDYTEAARLFRLAAAQGHADAQFNLGYIFESGKGVETDRVEAIRLYRLAAAQGNAYATAALKRLCA
jgi:TPR repeat protein